MFAAYADFLKFESFSQLYSTQWCFIAYLLLGQLVALIAWRLVFGRGKGEPSWWGRFGFVTYLLVAQVVLFWSWRVLIEAWQGGDPTFLADLVCAVHLGIILLVLVVLVLLPIGAWRRWEWTRNFWLRLTHLIVIEVVAGQAVVGLECPFTTLEHTLRIKAQERDLGRPRLDTDPPALHAIDNASAWGKLSHSVVFLAARATPMQRNVGYVVTGLLVLLTWLLIPPRLPWRSAPARDGHDGGPTAKTRPPEAPGASHDPGPLHGVKT